MVIGEHADAEVLPEANVEIRTLQQLDIETGLREGGLDLGLVNLLDDDVLSETVVGTTLLVGRPVVVLPADHPLLALTEIGVEDLRAHPFIGMRSGYLMHRFVMRLFDQDLPREWHTTDGADLGKVMVAEGLGLSVLPDYSVVDDPLERAGVIATRPIVGNETQVRLVMVHSPSHRFS